MGRINSGTMQTQQTIGIISPCYNEEQVLPETILKINDLLISLVSRSIISDESFVAFIDDGSKDRTWKIIEENSLAYKHVKGLKLAGNVGHQMHCWPA